MRRYLLYPPFLTVREETDFSDVWESFCLKLLKLDYSTTNIERRRPPESGIDLYYREKAIAFQCKSTLEGVKFNINNAYNSLQSALTLKSSMPWHQYIICSNENLTGKQIENLQQYDQSVESRGKDYWISLCERFPDQVKSNFRVLCDVPENRIRNDFNLLINGESEYINSKLKKNLVNVLLYSDSDEIIYNIILSLDLTVAELLLIIRRVFSLQEATKEYKGSVLLNPYFILNNQRFNEQIRGEITLGEIGLKDSSLLSFGLELQFPRRQMSRSIMFLNEVEKKKLDEKEIIKQVFDRFYNSI